MKIYTKIVIDIETMETILEESFEYSGDIALCNSGGGVNTEDKEYNARMAALSEEQQRWAAKTFNKFMYGVEYDPNKVVTSYVDKNGQTISVPNGIKLGTVNNYNPDAHISEMDLMDKQIQDAFGLTDDETKAMRSQFSLQTATNKAGEEVLPSQTEAVIAGNELSTDTSRAGQEILPSTTESTIAGNELSTATSKAGQEVLPSQTEATISGNKLTTAQNTADMGLVPQRALTEQANLGETRRQIALRRPIVAAYYDEAGKKINVNDRMNEASADVAQAAGAQRESLGRNIALRGGNITSGYGRSAMTDLANNTIKADAFARTNARRTTETEQLNRYRDALTLGDL